MLLPSPNSIPKTFQELLTLKGICDLHRFIIHHWKVKRTNKRNSPPSPFPNKSRHAFFPEAAKYKTFWKTGEKLLPHPSWFPPSPKLFPPISPTCQISLI